MCLHVLFVPPGPDDRDPDTVARVELVVREGALAGLRLRGPYIRRAPGGVPRFYVAFPFSFSGQLEGDAEFRQAAKTRLLDLWHAFRAGSPRP